MSKAVVTDYTFPDLDIEKGILEALGCSVDAHKTYQGPDKLKQLVADADYIITQFAPVKAEIIESMTKCQVIVRYGIGVDNVDLEAAQAKNIPVCNIPDYCIDEVADHTLSFILALSRRIVNGWDIVRNGQWKLAVPLEQMRTLSNMTVGLIAYGKIAKQVAARLKGFNCKILVFDPFAEETLIKQDGFIKVSLEEIYAQCDLISLHCPSTAVTKYMIQKQSIKKMKQGVILVNTSRGTLIKVDDLIEALESGRVSAAALDVTDPEPINTDSPLLKMDNVIITSHIASISTESIKTLRTYAAGIVAKKIQGEILPNVVNGL